MFAFVRRPGRPRRPDGRVFIIGRSRKVTIPRALHSSKLVFFLLCIDSVLFLSGQSQWRSASRESSTSRQSVRLPGRIGPASRRTARPSTPPARRRCGGPSEPPPPPPPAQPRGAPQPGRRRRPPGVPAARRRGTSRGGDARGAGVPPNFGARGQHPSILLHLLLFLLLLRLRHHLHHLHHIHHIHHHHFLHLVHRLLLFSSSSLCPT